MNYQTTTTTDGTYAHRVCDACGRLIPTGKSYLNIGGWIICGLCQYWGAPKQEPQDINHYKESCLHDGCPECHGTGVRKDGGMCIHGISCPCPKCSPRC